MALLEQFGAVIAGREPVGGHHHALARGEPVVLDHPGRAETVERRVQLGRAVDDLAVRGPHPGHRHHIFRERLRPFDPGRVGRRTEHREPGRAHGVGDAEHQRHLGTDHHQVSGHLGGQRGNGFAGAGIDRA